MLPTRTKSRNAALHDSAIRNQQLFQGVSKRYLSSSRGQHQGQPRLSRRAKVDLFVIAAGAVGSWLYLRDSDWERDAWEEKERLLDSAKNGNINTSQASNDELPMPLRKYLETAMTNDDATGISHDDAKVVSVDQKGAFFASHQWYPFHSNLLIKTGSHHQDDLPGFVWEAAVSILKMPNRVLETYIKGHGSITTKAWGKVPLIQVEEEEPYILFWLAMAPLIPSAFALPPEDASPPLISWNSVQDLHTCSVTLIDRSTNERFEMELQFDPTTHLLQSIRVTSPCLPYPWQAQYRNYQVLAENNDSAPSRILVPSHIEVGKWKDNGHLELHLKITNERMHPIELDAYHPANG